MARIRTRARPRPASASTASSLTGPRPRSSAAPARNRHRSGIAWSKGAIRAILRNPRYTGRQVWNRQSRDEQLIDVEDVAMGHKTRQVWNDQADWIWSAEQAQEADARQAGDTGLALDCREMAFNASVLGPTTASASLRQFRDYAQEPGSRLYQARLDEGRALVV